MIPLQLAVGGVRIRAWVVDAPFPARLPWQEAA
jgi:hypothetical protein